MEDRDNDTAVLVRSRVRVDAERLAAALGASVLETPDADYRFRVRASKADWAAYVAESAAQIDYDNFKNAVAARQGSHRALVYGQVWSVLLGLQSAGRGER